jgi:SseB protein N-terminal domain/SseB protein C-terminal domain
MFRRRQNSNKPAFPTDHAGDELLNTALIEAMRNVSIHDTKETRALLFQLLLESTLVTMSPTSPEGHRAWTAKAGETLDLVTFADDEGTVLPVFTSTHALLRFRPDGGGYVALPARALFEMAVNAGTTRIALDSGSPTTGFITRYEIEALARGRLPIGGSEVVTEDTEARIGRPASPPSEDVMKAVGSALEASPHARRAWLTMIQQGTSPPETMIAIRLDDVDDASAAMRSLIDQAGASAAAVRDLRFMRADDSFEATLSGGAGQLIFER